jgi:hypothetical protein
MSKNVKIYFSKTKDYKIVPATGVWGGVSPNGDIFFDLFIDKHDSPEYLVLKVDSDNKTEEVERGEQKLVRESQIGITLRPDNALVIGKWLIGKAEAAGAIDITKKKN